ncbi:MAG: ribosome maturation factor RimP [Acidimicrobiales bacterium]|nr:ribosome maturation factor RimP [Acidimicrobiales bacterium]
MATADRVQILVEPILEAEGLELYDLELDGGVLRVLVDREGGADIGSISKVARALSRALDEHDPIDGRYTLEVSTPGLERPLRTPGHFAQAIGTAVKVKTKPGVEGDRRSEGTIAAADADGVTVRDDAGVARTFRYEDIERARTVFVWGPANDERKAKVR